MFIRFIEDQDIKDVLQIYKPYIENTTITFEYTVPSLEEFTQRVHSIKKQYPYLVAIENNQVVGYGYASSFRERMAYQWDVELSVYVKDNYHRKGIGKAIYKTLLTCLKQQGFYKAYACITSPNPSSIQFHKDFGFQYIGKFSKTGYKFDQWLDVVFYEYDLQEDNKPQKLLEIEKVQLL